MIYSVNSIVIAVAVSLFLFGWGGGMVSHKKNKKRGKLIFHDVQISRLEEKVRHK